MKASLVSATSVIALLALEANPAEAANIFTLSTNPAQATCSNVANGCVVQFYALPGAASQSVAVTLKNITASAADTDTLGAPPAGFGGKGKTVQVLGAGSTFSDAYTYTPGASAGATGISTASGTTTASAVQGSTSQLSTFTLVGNTVAPIQSVSNGGTNAGFVLIQNSNFPSATTSAALTLTVTNTGHGNQATGGPSSISNLNGSVSASGSGEFATASPTSVSLPDAGSQTFTYVFAPSVRGAQSATVTNSFSNGNASGNNTSQSVTTVLSGTGVAPQEGSVSGGGAGDVLVGTSRSVGVTITNVGDGNKSGQGAASNLNGSITSVDGFFSGAPTFTIGDTASTTVNVVFTASSAPGGINPQSSNATAAFMNGSTDGMNRAHADSTTVTGTAVAPIESVSSTPGVQHVLVGNSATATVTVTNTGHGNLDAAAGFALSNLQGSIGSGNSVFVGAGSTLQGSETGLRDGASQTTTYVFTPTKMALVESTTNVVTTFTNGSNNGLNNASTVTSALNGQGVAPVEGMTGEGAGATLVGHSNVATVTVNNTGNGNQSGLGAISNLNGNISSPAGSGQFSGPPAGTNPLSLPDTSSTTVSYVFAPTTRGASSATVTGTFSNGSSDGTNQAHSNSVVVSGQGVAPIQNTDSSVPTAFVLVGTSKSLSFTVRNTGDGNLSNLGAISNLNGSVSSAGVSGDPQFTGPSPDPTTFSLADSSSTSVSFVFTPTVKGPSVSTTVTTQFSNGNASGNNAADSATTTLTGQGVAPVNSVTTTAAVARIGGAAGTGTVTVANVGNGNLATGGPNPISNLQVSSISGPSGGGFSGANSGAFTLPDGTSSAAASTTSTYNYSYMATARGTFTNTVVTTFANGSTDGTNSAGVLSTTVQGQAVGPTYKSTYGPASGPVGNAWTTPSPAKQTISFGTVGIAGSKTIFLDITNATADLGADALTGLNIGSFSLTGPNSGNFSLAGFAPTLLHSAANGGGVLEVALNFTATGAGSYTGDLDFTTDQDAAFGDTLDGNTFDYVLRAQAGVPEPATWLVMLAGLGGLAAVRRRKSPK